MPTIGEVILNVVPSTKGFSTALRAEMAPAMAQAESTTAKAGGAFTKFGSTAALGMAVAGAAVLEFGRKSIDAYSEHQQVLAQLQNTISNSPALVGATTQAFEEQATALQNVTGFQDELVLSADNVLARFNLTQQQIEDTIPTVLDYARATGKEVPEAAESIGKALLGNTRALKTLGISFTATGNRARDMDTIMDALRGKVGGAAEAFGQTLAGKLEIAKARLDDVMETIGARLVPVLTQLLKAVEPLLGVLGVLADHLLAVGIAFASWKLLGALPGLLEKLALAAAGMDLERLFAGLSSVGTAIAELAGPIGIAIAAALAFQQVLSALDRDLTEKTKAALEEGGKAFDDYAAKIDSAAGKFHGFFGGLLRVFVPGAEAVSQSLDKQKESLDGTTGAMILQERQAAALVQGYEEAYKASKTLDEGVRDAGNTMDAASEFFGKQLKTVNDLAAAWVSWRDTTAASLSGVDDALSTFSQDANGSVNDLILGLERNRTAMTGFATDLETISRRGGDGADDLVQHLLSMGQEGAHAAEVLANAHDRQFHRVLGIWNDTQGKAETFADQLATALAGSFDRIAGAILIATGQASDMTGALRILGGMHVTPSLTFDDHGAASEIASVKSLLDNIPRSVHTELSASIRVYKTEVGQFGAAAAQGPSGFGVGATTVPAPVGASPLLGAEPMAAGGGVSGAAPRYDPWRSRRGAAGFGGPVLVQQARPIILSGDLTLTPESGAYVRGIAYTETQAQATYARQRARIRGG